jgi:hypothetical protein
MPVKSKVKTCYLWRNGNINSINVIFPNMTDFEYFYRRWIDIRIKEYGSNKHSIRNCKPMDRLPKNKVGANMSRPYLFLDGDYSGINKLVRTYFLARHKNIKKKYWKIDPYASDEEFEKLLRELYLFFLKKPRRKKNERLKKREELVTRKNLIKSQAIRRWQHYWRWILENKWRIFENDDIYAPITWKLDRKEFRRDE